MLPEAGSFRLREYGRHTPCHVISRNDSGRQHNEVKQDRGSDRNQQAMRRKLEPFLETTRWWKIVVP